MDGTSRHRIFMDGEGNTGYEIVGKEKENTIKQEPCQRES
jgi:hypothetical protein